MAIRNQESIIYRCAGCMEAFGSHKELIEHQETCQALAQWKQQPVENRTISKTLEGKEPTPVTRQKPTKDFTYYFIQPIQPVSKIPPNNNYYGETCQGQGTGRATW